MWRRYQPQRSLRARRRGDRSRAPSPPLQLNCRVLHIKLHKQILLAFEVVHLVCNSSQRLGGADAARSTFTRRHRHHASPLFNRRLSKGCFGVDLSRDIHCECALVDRKGSVEEVSIPHPTPNSFLQNLIHFQTSNKPQTPPFRAWRTYRLSLQQASALRLRAQKRQCRLRVLLGHVTCAHSQLRALHFARWKAALCSRRAANATRSTTCSVITRRRRLACLR
jgi:hypothetical protein